MDRYSERAAEMQAVGLRNPATPKNGSGFNGACMDLEKAVESMSAHIEELEQVLEGAGVLSPRPPQLAGNGVQTPQQVMARLTEGIATQTRRVHVLCALLSEIKARIDA